MADDANDDPRNERQASKHQGRGERIAKVAAYGIVVAVGFAFIYSSYCVFRAISSGTGQWHNTRIADWSLLGVTSAYVIATVLQWRVTQGLLRITADQLEETRCANTLALQARLFVESVTMEGDLGPDTRAKVTVRNYGKIPAIRVCPLGRYEVAESLRPIQPRDSETPGVAIIGAGRSHDFYFSPWDIRADKFDAIRQGHGHGVLLLSTRFKYTDALKTEGDTIYPVYYVLSTPTRPAHFSEIPGGSSVS